MIVKRLQDDNLKMLDNFEFEIKFRIEGIMVKGAGRRGSLGPDTRN